MFCVIGVAIGWFLSGRPIHKAIQSRSWLPASCEVTSSRVAFSDDTSRVDIQYRYRVSGRTYIGTHYDFTVGSDNFGDKNAIVAAYPVGHVFECYVNPDGPAEAVIDRELKLAYFFGLVFLLFFTIVPLGIMLVWFAVIQKARQPASERVTALRAVEASESGPVVLKPTHSPVGKLLGSIFVCLFWNGIVGVFTYFEIMQFQSGDPSWFLALFLLLFQLIGLVLLINVPYQLLALANPRPTITLSSRTVPVGGSLQLEWQLSGAASRVNALRLTLEGREEARYRRGTDTRTDTNVFHHASVVEMTDSMGVARGTASIRIPADTMHTFAADNNKIIWTLKMHGDIKRWPDIDESFEITVRPK